MRAVVDGHMEKVHALEHATLMTLPPGEMTPQKMMAAFEDSDFEKMEEIRARAESVVRDRETAENLKASRTVLVDRCKSCCCTYPVFR